MTLQQSFTDAFEPLLHAQREQLGNDRVAESVEHETGKPVALTVDESVGGGLGREVEEPLAEIDGPVQQVQEPGVRILDRAVVEQTQCELGAGIVEPGPHELALAVADQHRTARRDRPVGSSDHLAKEPWVTTRDTHLESQLREHREFLPGCDCWHDRGS